jgi:transposase-like protein
VLRQMVQFAAQRLMEVETETLCGAGYDEKSAERLNSRNGFRPLRIAVGCVRPPSGTGGRRR